MRNEIDLKETLKPRGGTFQLRGFLVDKEEFEQLQRELTVKLGGEPVSQAAVLHYLLEIRKMVEGKK